ncbi:MAG TPA: hypothetical protein VNT75_13475, partial [Symbiobacteriaceae bacterium]|nr:hypothetical protein [Symbiobacteriaceae bacterium]
RWIVLTLGCLLLAGAGCSAGVPDHSSRPLAREPVQVSWEVTTAYQRLPAQPGETVSIDGWSAVVTARFSAPVPAAELRPRVEGGTWHVSDIPVQVGENAVAFRLRADLAGNAPANFRLDGPVQANLTLKPRTPPVTPDEEEALTALGLRIWGMAAAGDEPALRALIAPEPHLSAPGGEFQADGFGAGLPAVLGWAKARAGVTPRVTVEPRMGYSSLDLVVLDTGRGKLALYVTIPGRRVAKMFGI